MSTAKNTEAPLQAEETPTTEKAQVGRLQKVLRLLSFGQSDDEPPPPEEFQESSLPEVVVWQHFDIDKMHRDLQKIRQKYEEDQRPVILSFDIDGTIYRDPKKHSDPFQFFVEQRTVFKHFDQWLHLSPSPLQVILIYNTARDYTGYEPFSEIRASGLPAPHILIEQNGSIIHLNPKYMDVAEIQAISPDIEALNTKLQDTLKANNAAIDAQLAPAQESINQALTTLADRKKSARTRTSLFCEQLPEVRILFQYIVHLCSQPEYGKSFSADRYTPAFYYFDRQVNKGVALLMVLRLLLPHIPGDTRLYTAGDDMPDLPMLFPTLQTNAFRADDDRSYGSMGADLLKMGVPPEDFQKIRRFWQAAIVPDTMHYMLRIVLQRTGLLRSPKLYNIPVASLPLIMGVIAGDSLW